MKKYMVFLPLIVAISAQFMPDLYFFSISLVLVLFILLVEPAFFKKLFSKYFILFLAFLVLIQPLFAGIPDTEFAGIWFSSKSMYSGLKMAFRAMILMTTINYILKRANKHNLSKLWSGITHSQFDMIYAEAGKIYTVIFESIKVEFKKNGIRRWFTSPIKTSSAFLVVLIRSTVHDDNSNTDYRLENKYTK